jgi:hypothetical protein
MSATCHRFSYLHFLGGKEIPRIILASIDFKNDYQ